MKDKYPRVTVDWVDSAHTPGWRDPETFDYTLATCQTTGYLVRKDAAVVMVALSCSQNMSTEVGHCITIPLVAVKKLRKIK